MRSRSRRPSGGQATEPRAVVAPRVRIALGRRIAATSDIALAGAFLVGLSTLQVEFDYGVPQFRQLEHPILIAIGAGIALVAARIRIGRGGALAAVLMFLAIRGALALGVASFGRIPLHFPLYVVAALLVKAVALAVPRNRQITLGAIAGAAIGTIGFAAEWAWSRAWMPMGWTDDILPEAIVVAVAGTAAGVPGGFVGRALLADGARQPTPRGAAVLGWAGVVAAIGFALPMTAHADWSADLRLEPAGADLAYVTVRLDPADAAEGAAWFNVLSWQGASDGEDGGTSSTELARQPDGSYRTVEPVPVAGKAKTMLRLHKGRSMQVVPIYLPEDDAIPAAEVPAEDGVRLFQPDKRVLQREARTDNVNLERGAYVLLALVAAGWMAVIAWGLVRLERPPRVLLTFLWVASMAAHTVAALTRPGEVGGMQVPARCTDAPNLATRGGWGRIRTAEVLGCPEPRGTAPGLTRAVKGRCGTPLRSVSSLGLRPTLDRPRRLAPTGTGRDARPRGRMRAVTCAYGHQAAESDPQKPAESPRTRG